MPGGMQHLSGRPRYLTGSPGIIDVLICAITTGSGVAQLVARLPAVPSVRG